MNQIKKNMLDIFDIFENFKNDTMSVPSINVKETETNHQIQVSAPGYKKENFQIDVDDNVLTISNTHSEEDLDKGELWTRKEFRKESFSRAFYLPDGLDTDKISAVYEDGILYIDIPKIKNLKGQTKKVEIK